jgi:hypothetical protein
MASQLPVPVRFELPDGWERAQPDEVGAPSAAFVALNTATRGAGFTANITVDGSPLSRELTTMADESVREISGAVRSVRVANRQEIGSPEAPGLAQDLRVVADVNGVVRELAQFQVYLTVAVSAGHGRDAVVRAVLTCADDQIESVLDDFRSFLGALTSDIS